MRKRYVFGSGLVLLAILLTLVEWQVSFKFGDYGPANTAQTFVYWAVSTLIFLLTVTLGFMLFRTFVKLYIERQSDREGSRIKFKLVFGALALSVLPVVFLVLFGYAILNHNLDKWFSLPAEGVRMNLIDTGVALGDEVQGRAQALANWIASSPEVRSGTADFAKLCVENRIAVLRLETPAGTRDLCPASAGADLFTARAALSGGQTESGAGTVIVRVRPRIDLAKKQNEIQRYARMYAQAAADRRNFRNLYSLFLLLIALFILFVATWIALLLSRQISMPISALLVAAGEVRKGNLGHRVRVKAIDELATLVRAFNEMMHELEANSRELESRRSFTEAILESIPTGVISLAADGRIQRVNRALRGLFTEEEIDRASHMRDLFPPERCSGDGVPDESRAAHRSGGEPDRPRIHQSGHAGKGDAPGGNGLRAARAPARRARIRGGARRYQRAAESAKGRGMARSSAPHRPRIEESAHAHRSVRRAHCASA